MELFVLFSILMTVAAFFSCINVRVLKLPSGISLMLMGVVAALGVIAMGHVSSEDVAGPGDAAGWNSFERRLYLLDNGVVISLTVDMSSDEAINKGKAILI